MKRSTIAALSLCAFTFPALSAAETHDIALHDLSDDVLAGSLEFDAGAALTGITSVKLILQGTWTESLWTCPGGPFPLVAQGEDYVYGEIRDEGDSFAYVVYGLSGGFGREVTAQLFYGKDWSPLLDGVGIIDLMFEIGPPAGAGYSCGLVEFGTLDVSQASLRFEAEGVVGDEPASWGALKATFR